jgi:hypothetical protein
VVGPGLEDRASADLEGVTWARALEVLSLVYEVHVSRGADDRPVGLRRRTEADLPPAFPPPSAEPPIVKVFAQPQGLNPADVVGALRLAVPDSARVDLGPNATLVFRGTVGGAALAEAFLKKLALPPGTAATKCGVTDPPSAAAPRAPPPLGEEAPIYRALGWTETWQEWCGEGAKVRGREVSFGGETTSVHRTLATLLATSERPFVLSPLIRGELSVRASGPWDCLARTLAQDLRLRVLETPDGILVAVTEDDRVLEVVPPPPEPVRACFFAIPAGKEADKYAQAVRLALSRAGRVVPIRPVGAFLPFGLLMVRDIGTGLAAAEDIIRRFNAADPEKGKAR